MVLRWSGVLLWRSRGTWLDSFVSYICMAAVNPDPSKGHNKILACKIHVVWSLQIYRRSYSLLKAYPLCSNDAGGISYSTETRIQNKFDNSWFVIWPIDYKTYLNIYHLFVRNLLQEVCPCCCLVYIFYAFVFHSSEWIHAKQKGIYFMEVRWNFCYIGKLGNRKNINDEPWGTMIWL